jgi:serine/threonine-protein kinase
MVATEAEAIDPIGAEPPASCSRFDTSIARLGTAALDADDEARVRAHLATCERCAELARLFSGDPSGDDDDDAESAAELANEAAPIVAGATIAGRYRLDRILGRGGMGVVWAATQSLTGQPVAIKLLDERRGDPRARRRFLREARSACAARHPNVVRVYDVVELPGGAPAIVMELLAGHSLQRRFDQGPMPVGDVCHVLGRVAAAAFAAHAVGIVHRDLKPENVFLARTASGGVEVKVLDFGVAKRTALAPEQTAGDLTRTGALVGTPF